MNATNWPKIVRDLMAERKMSERKLCATLNINRNSFRYFLHDGRDCVRVSQLEAILWKLGYELDCIRIDGKELRKCPMPPPASKRAAALSVAVKPVFTPGNATVSVKPRLTRSAPAQPNVDTAESGGKRVLHS